MPAVARTPDLPGGAEPERGPKAKHNNWQSLKCWREPFQRILAREKRCDFRSIADRVFHVSEIVNLYEWDPARAEYTGDFCTIQIMSIDIGPEFDIPAEHALLSIALKSWAAAPPEGAREYLEVPRDCPVCLQTIGDTAADAAAASERQRD